MKNVGLLCIAMLFLCGTVYAERTVWYVHPDSALNTIQAGLDSCADNDIVLVGPGTYVENIIWPNTQGIHMISELGPDFTVIDGDSVNRVIEISIWIDTTSLISGFTIQNGFDTLGAGIFCSAACSPTITNNNIRNNVAGFGTEPMTPWADGIGAGICCDTASSPVITNNTITNNKARGHHVFGGGISCHSSAPLISNNIITGNTAQGQYWGYGGGIACMHSSPIISGNTITLGGVGGGEDCGGAGILCGSFSSPIISDNIISFNNSDGISCGGDSTSPIIDNCTVEQNAWAGISCGGGNGVHPVIQYCDIFGQSRGIYSAFGGEPEIQNCNIFDNSYYGVDNDDAGVTVDADSNWWGDATGPYHPVANPGGLGNAVSDYVDFDPWLSWPVGVKEQPIVKPIEQQGSLSATIFRGPLQLPKDKKCKVFDITGRVVEPSSIKPGIYFIEVDGVVTQKVVKVR